MNRCWMICLLLWPLVAASALPTVGCGSTPQRRYYVVSYPLPNPDEAPVAPHHPISLRVRPIQAALAYDRPQIVYRQSPFEFQYYSYRLWSAKPQKMIREVVASHIQAARLVQEVTLEIGERMPDYELSADLLGIEEYDSGDVWYGHLAMRFWLSRNRDKQIIWTYQFDEKKKVYHKDPVYVVRALSQILEEQVDLVIAGIDQALGGATPSAPPPTPSAPPRPSPAAGGVQ